MNPGPATDNDIHILRTICHADVFAIAHVGEPARPTVLEAGYRAFAKTRQGNSCPLKDRVSDVVLAEAVTRKRCGMLRAENEKRAGREYDVIVAQAQHRSNKVIENLRAALATIGEHVVRR